MAVSRDVAAETIAALHVDREVAELQELWSSRYNSHMDCDIFCISTWTVDRFADGL